MKPRKRSSRGLTFILVTLLVIGVAFRFINLGHKVYWHDEVYTSIRAAGYTRQEIDQTLFQNRLIQSGDLQRFQQIKPGSTMIDTVRSLAVEDPQHPPLYFVLSRLWMQWLGNSPAALRSLATLLSLLSLPLMYALAEELFASRPVALLATTLLAVSPFEILFAQNARQYGLLMTAVIASHWLLLRALRLEATNQSIRATLKNWALYTLALTVGWYTHPLFALAVLAQAVYVILRGLANWSQRSQQLRSFGWFCLSGVGAIVLYLPWLQVLLNNSQRAAAVTDWTRTSPGLAYLVKLWTLSFTSLFFDLDFGFTNPVTFLLRLPILVLLGAAVYTILRRCHSSVWLWILTAILVPFLLLALPDLILGGKRSTISRYLIPCYPGIQVAIAYLLHTAINSSRALPQKIWQGVLALLVIGSVVSCTVSALADTWWDKDLSYHNAEVAQRVNAIPSALVISDIGDDFTNTGELLSLSYRFNPSIPLLLVDRNSDWIYSEAFKAQRQRGTPLVFRPSNALRQALEQNGGQLQSLIQSARLWQLVER